MSLVANYTDSEDDEDRPEECGEKVELIKTNITIGSDSNSNIVSGRVSVDDSAKKEELDGQSTNSKTSSSLLGVGNEDGSQSSDSDSNSSSDGDANETEHRKIRSPEVQLDNPFRFFGSGNVSTEDSVLRVEFREKELHKTAVLERHVKMTETAGAALTINGKKICWNHRRGKCRFGHNCKFAHESDILPTNSDESLKHDKNFQPISSEGIPQQFKKRNPFSLDHVNWDSDDIPSQVVLSSSARLSGQCSSMKKKNDSSDEEGVDSRKFIGKKKRPGLPSDLVPGKKAMKMYYQTKDKPV